MLDRTHCWWLAGAALALMALPAGADPIPIAAVDRAAPVSFEREILPILQKNCLACHSAGEANGELVLESPQTMLKGGDSGPAVVPGKSGESLLLKLASHQDEPVMPPPKNSVAAVRLTSEQLGLIKLWIDQGAKGTGTARVLSPERWRVSASETAPIYAVAVSPDGQFVACARGSRIVIYHVATGQQVTQLADPALLQEGAFAGIAHLDAVHSLAINRQGDLLASGGFRTVKLWRSPRDVQRFAVQAPAPLRSVAVNQEGTLAVIGGGDGSITLCDLATGQAVQTLSGHTGEVRSLCFSRDQTLLISASADRTVRTWNLADAAPAGRIDTPAEVNAAASLLPPAVASDPVAAAPSPPVEWVATGGADNLVRLWRLPRRLPQPLPDAPPQARLAVASRDGKLLAIAGSSGLVRVIDVRSHALVKQWQAHAGTIHGAAVCVFPEAEGEAGGKVPAARLATAGDDGTVCVWNPAADEPPLVLHGTFGPVLSVDIRPDGKQLVAGAADGGATVWNLETAPPLSLERSESPATVVVVSPDGKLLAAAGMLHGRPAVIVRDLATGKTLHTFFGHDAPVVALAFSHDSARVASGSQDKTARVWDLRDAKFPEAARFVGHTAAVTAVAFGSDGTQVLSGSADNSLKLWALADGAELMNFPGHTGPVVAVAMPGNNQPISASADKTVRFWNPANGQPARTQSEPAAVTALALSRDGQRLAVALEDKTVKVYPAGGGNPQFTLAGHQQPVGVLSFSADNARLLSAAAGEMAAVWDLADGRLLEILPGAEPKLTAAAFGPAADKVVLADSAGAVALHSLRFAGALRGMTKPVTAVGYHPGGQLILTGCEDGTVRGFNTNYQQAFAVNHGAAVRDLAVSADGQRLASGGDDKLIRLWNPANGGQLQPPQLSGFTAAVRGVCFSTDGTRVIGGSAAEAGELLVFHAATGLQEESLVGSAGAITACAGVLDADRSGGSVVSVSSDGSVRQWALSGVAQFAGHSQPVTSLAAWPAEQNQPPQIVSGSLDGTIRRWNVQNGQVLMQLNHGGPVESVAVRGDGQRIASASSNNTVKLWNAANNQQLAEMRGDLRARTRVARLTQQKNDAAAYVQQARAAAEASERDLPAKSAAEKTAADALAAATKDVEAKAAALAAASSAKAQAEKVAIEAAAAAQKAATAMEEANRRALELAAAARLLMEKAARAQTAATADPNNPALAKAAAEALALAGAAEAEARAADAAKAAPAKTAADMAAVAADAAQKALATNKPFDDAAVALAQSQSARKSAEQAHAVAARDLKLAADAVPATKADLTKAEALLKQVDEELARAVAAEAAAQQPCRSVAFSPDGRSLASGGDFGVVHTWDAETGNALASFAGHTAPVSGVAYVSAGAAGPTPGAAQPPAAAPEGSPPAPGSQVLVSVSADRSAIAWDLNPGWRLERTIGRVDDPAALIDRVLSVDFNTEGTLLATGGGVPSRGGEVKIWSVADGTLVRELADPHTDAVNGVAFSPDGRRLATAAADKFVKLFDIETGQPLLQFEGHTNHVLGVAWRAGGKTLASCGADGTIKLWNAETGDRLVDIQGFNKQVTAVRFVGQTQFIVSSSGDPFVRMHNSDNGGVQVNYGGPSEYMYAVDATADPTNGVVVAGGHDGVLRIWTANGQPRHALAPPPPNADHSAGR